MFPRKVQSSARRLFVRRRMMSGIPSKLIHIEQTVKEALANGEPVVALESTIIGTILSTSFSMQVNNNGNIHVASLNLFFFASLLPFCSSWYAVPSKYWFGARTRINTEGESTCMEENITYCTCVWLVHPFLIHFPIIIIITITSPISGRHSSHHCRQGWRLSHRIICRGTGGPGDIWSREPCQEMFHKRFAYLSRQIQRSRCMGCHNRRVDHEVGAFGRN